MAIDGTAVCVGCWTSPRPATLGAFAPSTALSHNRVRPCCGPCATQSETPKESVAPCPRELTGKNSPLYLSANENENRPGTSEIFLYWYVVAMNAYKLLRGSRSKRCDSWNKEIELFGCSAVRCLGNAAKSIKQALDAMPYRYDRMATAPG